MREHDQLARAAGNLIAIGPMMQDRRIQRPRIDPAHFLDCALIIPTLLGTGSGCGGRDADDAGRSFHSLARRSRIGRRTCRIRASPTLVVGDKVWSVDAGKLEEIDVKASNGDLTKLKKTVQGRSSRLSRWRPIRTSSARSPTLSSWSPPGPS